MRGGGGESHATVLREQAQGTEGIPWGTLVTGPRVSVFFLQARRNLCRDLNRVMLSLSCKRQRGRKGGTHSSHSRRLSPRLDIS